VSVAVAAELAAIQNDIQGRDPNEEATGPRLCISLMDYEPQWKAYTTTLAGLFAPEASVEFHTCNVIEPIREIRCQGDDHCDAESRHDSDDSVSTGCTRESAGSNLPMVAALPCADLFVFAYVVHETSKAASSADWSFYKDLGLQCKPGAVLVFADVMGHSAQVFADVHAAMLSAMQSAKDCRTVVRLPTPDTTASLRSEIMVLQVCL